MDASRRTSRKTRIIGLANLNPGYFDSYAQFCLDHRLLELTADGYQATELADQVIVAIRRILSKSAELDGAIRSLGTVIRRDQESGGVATDGNRAYTPDDWQEILLHSVPRLSLPNTGVTVRAPRANSLLRASLPLSVPAPVEAPLPAAAPLVSPRPGRPRERSRSARGRDRPELAP